MVCQRLFAELIDKYALKPIGVQPLEIIFAEKPSDVNVLDVDLHEDSQLSKGLSYINVDRNKKDKFHSVRGSRTRST